MRYLDTSTLLYICLNTCMETSTISLSFPSDLRLATTGIRRLLHGDEKMMISALGILDKWPMPLLKCHPNSCHCRHDKRLSLFRISNFGARLACLSSKWDLALRIKCVECDAAYLKYLAGLPFTQLDYMNTDLLYWSHIRDAPCTLPMMPQLRAQYLILAPIDIRLHSDPRERGHSNRLAASIMS